MSISTITSMCQEIGLYMLPSILVNWKHCAGISFLSPTFSASGWGVHIVYIKCSGLWSISPALLLSQKLISRKPSEITKFILKYAMISCSVYLPFSFALGWSRCWWIAVPVPFPLVDEPVIDLLELQSCFLHQSCLVLLLNQPVSKWNHIDK